MMSSQTSRFMAGSYFPRLPRLRFPDWALVIFAADFFENPSDFNLRYCFGLAIEAYFLPGTSHLCPIRDEHSPLAERLEVPRPQIVPVTPRPVQHVETHLPEGCESTRPPAAP